MSPLVPPSRSAVGLLALAVAFLVALVRVPSPLAAMDHGGGRPFDPRVFAATEAPGGLPPGSFVPDFRLTDHTGTTRELYYESTTKAIVLVFTGTGHPRALQTASALRALRTRFNAATLTLWQIDSNLAADRAAVAAEQTLFNNDTPVLMDDAQIVAAEYGATSQLEAFVINPANWTLSYRGPLDNADPATLAAPTQNFVADAVAALVAGTASPAGTRVSLPAAARPLDLPAATVPDYATEVAPIVLRRCVSCHSPGNIAPHVYGKFSDLADRGPAIRQDMLLKKMSPWHADPRYGAWANNAALTPAEAATLSAWARAGAPRGAALVDPLAFAPAPAGGDWPLGQPDLILSLPRKSLPSTGTLSYDYPELTIPNTEDKWLRAVYVKPGNRRVVHHALVLEGSQIELILQAITTGSLPGLNGFFAGYVPGLEQTWFPDGSGKLLKKGSKITVQMHYTTSGQPETDDTQLGFYFTATAPARELLTKSANNVNLSIPPGAKDYAREATFVPSTTKDVMLYELNPHMHYRGKRVRFDALYPDGTTETLLNVPQYDFNWQSQYRLAQPKRLPAGTAIRVSGAFDNSAQNPFNPNPRATVTFGEQTSDEMYIGYINYAELPDKVAT
ncbi:MAG: redoxin domain-containing protein, partial [Verrucomicrobia bacterium]|nr:redoxin domain-containing protein [Verrucomicrobiota bacterium]